MYLIPDYVFDSIYEITPLFFRAHGLRGMLIDLDGTMASSRAPLPNVRKQERKSVFGLW